ncbi:MAG: hypothetical protein QXT63_00630 [Thermoplasmata archaeon]
MSNNISNKITWKRGIVAYVVCILVLCVFVPLCNYNVNKCTDEENNTVKRCEKECEIIKKIIKTQENEKEREMPSVTIDVNPAYGPNWTIENNELPKLFDTRLYGHNLPIKQNQTPFVVK